MVAKAPESYIDCRRIPLQEAIELEGDMTINDAVRSLERKGYYSAHPGPWQLGYHDRGLGRGDFAVLDRFGDLVTKVENRADAELIILAVNAYNQSLDSGRGKLEDQELMDRLVNALADKVRLFLNEPEWAEKRGFSRSVYADTETIVSKIIKKERLDGLKIPADVSITIQLTCHRDFRLSIEDTYRVLSIYFSEYEINIPKD